MTESTPELPTFSEIAESLQILPDQEERIQYLIGLSRRLTPMPESEKVDSNRVWGCMSSVWLTCHREPETPEKLRYQGESDSVLVSGIVAIVISLYAHRTPEEILTLNADEALSTLNLDSYLSTARRNGLAGMIQTIRQHAGRAMEESTA